MSMMPTLHHRVELQVNFFSLPTSIVISQGEGSCLHVYDLNSFPSPPLCYICISAGSFHRTDTCSTLLPCLPSPLPSPAGPGSSGHRVRSVCQSVHSQSGTQSSGLLSSTNCLLDLFVSGRWMLLVVVTPSSARLD